MKIGWIARILPFVARVTGCVTVAEQGAMIRRGAVIVAHQYGVACAADCGCKGRCN